ncbi:fungal-specific transcription factor domain-containing protein [Hypoxylon cercidicola]|nr:fungal-specific transcription factor domain-containing protein [Hypoxylon cercidicola]
MFTSFPIPSTTSRPNPNPSSASPTATQPTRPRQNRSQVALACDWCRTHRTKCDDNYPCLNCQARGGQYSNDRTSAIRTLPHAFREIEWLRQRQKELQEELDEERNRNRIQTAPLVVPSSPQLLTPSGTSVLPQSTIVDPSGPEAEGGGSAQKYWEGIYIHTAKSPAKTWYGPSSLLYFISRLTVFLASKLQQYRPECCTQPNFGIELLGRPSNAPEKPTDEGDRTTPDDHIKAKDYLTPTQEEYFLDFYWQSYHTSLPILNENDFKRHYKSLWAGSRRNSKASALVDIVIALCMQYGMARARSNSTSLKAIDIDSGDAALADRLYYCRCQTILAYELDSPTISTLQCNILSVIWLCSASLQNIADNTLALTARTAQRLGLHQPPPQDVSPRERELRKRLWWSIYILETKISMKLGRPFLLHPSPISCGLPGDEHEVATLSGSNFTPLGDNITWLNWNLHNMKLVLVARNVYTAFYDKFTDFFNGDYNQTIYDTPTALETYADLLITQMKALESWVKDVPDALKTKRQSRGIPFSIDHSPLEMEQFAPFWVQHQRLLLELLYHNLCTNLYRPFISFKSTSPLSPLTQSSISSSDEACGVLIPGGRQVPTIPQSGQTTTASGQSDDTISTRFDEESVADMRDILVASMEMAFAVDGYNSSNMWWPGMGTAEL